MRLLLCALPALLFAAGGLAQDRGALIEPVTDAEVLDPPAKDWLMFRGNLANWGYSGLDKITRDNVNQLDLAWSFTMESGPVEATPVVRDGVIFVPNPGDVIHALDAATGDLIWEYRREWPEDFTGGGQGMTIAAIVRSIALYGDSIYTTTADAKLVRLNASTGEVVWESSTDNYNFTTHTTGPIIVKGMVVSGRNCSAALAGGCYIMAHDADDGRELWRFYLIPRPGEPGSETWGEIPFEKRLHVGAWHTGAYDPDTDLIIWGTSVPAPSPEVLRGSGDGHLLYSNSTVALDPDTGELVWYFQHLPRDNWDLDHPYERLLVDVEIEPDPEAAWVINPDVAYGEKRKVVTGIPGKTGLVWTLDRETGEFLWARPTVHQNVIAEIDPETGGVVVNESTIPRSLEDDYGTVCPSAGGGKNWPASSYSPRTQTMYLPLQNTCMEPEITTDDPQPQDLYAISFNLKLTPDVTNVGRLEAVSARTAHTVWGVDEPAGIMSTLATAGDLVFVAYSNRRLKAHDAETGEVLWEAIVNGPVSGYPISYETGGEQYVAVPVGGGDLLSGTWNRYAGLQVRSGSNTLYAFRLSATASEPGAATAARGRSDLRRTPAPEVATLAEDSLGADRDPLPRGTACVSFSAAQAERGAAVYEERCAECHGTTLRGGNHGSPLSGRFFQIRWADQRASALHATVRETMPPGGEGSLGGRATSRLLAYIFQTVGIESGAEPMSANAEALRELRICSGD
ncbi:MAG: PQQ-binding-like beta-propeller repeat protein [Acidobacteriota bacterium]|nr:PQQ-binding-like beta-propeller repeat protein [Acidobacteriota bacterium]